MTTRHWCGLAATFFLMQLSTVGLAASSKELSALGCMLQPSKIVEVSSPVSGVLEDVLVKRGDIVESGNILFHLKAGVEKAGVELARVKANFAKRYQIR